MSEKDKRPLSEMSPCNVCCAWIAPDGTAHHLGWKGLGSHHGVAYKLDDETGGRGLDEQGYLHLSYGSPYFGTTGQKPTQGQLDHLFDVLQELKRIKRNDPAHYIEEYLQKQEEGVTA